MDRPLPAERAEARRSVEELIAGDLTAGRFALVAMTVPQGTEPPRHRHQNEDEVIYVLAGEVEFQVGTERSCGAAGTAILIRRGIEHGFAVRSDEARLLTAFLPAGFEGFYREIAGVAPDDFDRLIATAARYACEVTGPPISADGRSAAKGGPHSQLRPGAPPGRHR